MPARTTAARRSGRTPRFSAPSTTATPRTIRASVPERRRVATGSLLRPLLPRIEPALDPSEERARVLGRKGGRVVELGEHLGCDRHVAGPEVVLELRHRARADD